MLNQNEIKFINKIAEAAKWEDYKVSRRSEREYDLSVEGRNRTDHPYLAGVAFSAWLPLVAIRELSIWTSPQIASLTNYPSMCEEGDWSGMRDSDPENIWEIFHRFVLK